MTGDLSVTAPAGVPEIHADDDLAGLVLGVLDPRDGDILAVTSKAVAKSERRVVEGTRADRVAAETVRVVARRGDTLIVRTRQGPTLAAAGIDASNVVPGSVVLLPDDPDRSARRLRTQLLERTGTNVGVLVTDTAGRPWRHGQTDLAIGAAGLDVIVSYSGRVDPYGNRLSVTAPAVADELAGAAELAQGKLSGRPFALLRGRADLVLPPGVHGAGARTLVRAEDEDLFGFGAREAVLRALQGDEPDRAGFGAPASRPELAAAIAAVLGPGAIAADPDAAQPLRVTGDPAVVAALAFAHGWTSRTDPSGTSCAPPTPP